MPTPCSEETLKGVCISVSCPGRLGVEESETAGQSVHAASTPSNTLQLRGQGMQASHEASHDA
jgi:hypothetical protein